MKPRVLTKCVANTYTGDDERIIEFSHKGRGGLISFRQIDEELRVDVYRADCGVRTFSKEWDDERKNTADLRRALAALLASHETLTAWMRENTGPRDGTLEMLTDAHYLAAGAASMLERDG